MLTPLHGFSLYPTCRGQSELTRSSMHMLESTILVQGFELAKHKFLDNLMRLFSSSRFSNIIFIYFHILRHPHCNRVKDFYWNTSTAFQFPLHRPQNSCAVHKSRQEDWGKTPGQHNFGAEKIPRFSVWKRCKNQRHNFSRKALGIYLALWHLKGMSTFSGALCNILSKDDLGHQ